MNMLDERGYFNQAWLTAQTTSRLRYEARCERIRDAEFLHRHKLLLVLGQLPIIPAILEKSGI